MKTYTIREYESFFVKDKNNFCADTLHPLPLKIFNELEKFILSNKSGSSDAIELMAISAKKNFGKVITAKNYVGVIKMNSGDTIEILPKIYSKIKEDKSGIESKKLVVRMLRTLKDSPFKNIQTANINLSKMNVFEFFIRLYIDEVFYIVKRGLKCSYETVEDNLPVYKGKMLFSKHVRLNAAHKERCYVEYDIFSVNRAENRILKATLNYLYRCSSSMKNRNDIRTLLQYFDGVDESKNYDADFSKCVLSRNTKDYDTALKWSKVFLKGKSFTSFSGSAVASALLFPMETLYESYIAALLKKNIDKSRYNISVQDKRYSLFDEFCGEEKDVFQLKPDIAVRKEIPDNKVFVMDTKWKILDSSVNNYGISQADMYQMFAYSIKYKADKVILLYPKTDLVKDSKIIEYKALNENVDIQVKFIDLFDVKSSIQSLIEMI